MSDAKTTLLVLGAGCAAMVGVAAAVVSAGSFFSDLPTTSAQAAAFQLPAHKVKTVSISDKPADKGAAVTQQTDRAPTSSVTVAVRERSALHGANPRWARETTANSNSLAQKQALLAAYADDESNSGNLAQDASTANDPFAVMVTPDESSEPTVDLAATVPHVPLPAPREERAREPVDDDPTPPKAATTGRALSGNTSLNEAANMRAAPRSGSKVILVVPDGARVSIAPGCEQWCEISYNGQRGFVYKDFVGSGRAAAVAKPRAKTDTASTEPLDKAIYGDSNFINSGGQPKNASDDDEKTASNTTTTAAKKPVAEPSMR
ncbi:MAG: SH3 domain-containing protein [Mesorhizobium sp.]